MKNSKSILFALICTMSLLVVSCKKENPEPEEQTPTASTPTGSTTPIPSNADGVMWAIRSTSSFQGFAIEIGTAVGIFMNGTTDLVNVGTVSVNSENLTASSNNAYTFTPNQTSPTGLDFSNSTDWSVSGGNGHAAFTYDASSLVFPTGSAITSAATVTKANGYTLTCSSVSGADSTLFLIGNVSKTVPGSANSCTFSASELSGLSAGTSVVMIVPYKLMQATINGKNYYFGKERVNQLAVTIE